MIKYKSVHEDSIAGSYGGLVVHPEGKWVRTEYIENTINKKIDEILTKWDTENCLSNRDLIVLKDFCEHLKNQFCNSLINEFDQLEETDDRPIIEVSGCDHIGINETDETNLVKFIDEAVDSYACLFLYLENQVINNINNYLEKSGITCQDLLKNNKDLLENNDAFIFGGAIRDSIANVKIQDIDIVCRSKAFQKLYKFLSENDFHISLETDMKNEYANSIILKPITFIKNDIKIQLIRPTYNMTLLSIVKHVDIRCCGVYLDKSLHIYEAAKHAVYDCENKKIVILRNSLMAQDEERLKARKLKLFRKGFTLANE